MSLFDSEDFAEHEQVVFCRDGCSGLSAIIAIHDTTLGPAVGGCRMRRYAFEDDAIRDALRLSRAMTYKNAMAELPLGGGKSVILGDPSSDKSEALLRAFGRCVDALGGRYVVAEDMGIGVRDIEIVARETRHVAGVSNRGGAGGDPSPFTAQGVLIGMRVAVEHRLGRSALDGLRVAVQGVGAVGAHLCRLLHEENAELIVADRNPAAAAAAVAAFGARAVHPEDLLAEEMDVFAPCALGGVLDDAATCALRASIVAGAANNQLAQPKHGDRLAERGVLFVPDYVINAGGMLNVAAELAGDYEPDAVMESIAAIAERLRGILREADAKGVAPFRIADARVREKLDAARLGRSAPDAECGTR
ncbi:MAG: amino acid dehydrogenase [Myxococcales bacterium]|nr:amino acid dehydrogenase [Myxococcales bacterium]MDH5306390.1 amino acid dehydrogenase [Myxococcales bacterium]MDH5566815.1 amino acid dehydrogenase [Myxococcales bacterium]